MHKGGAVNLKLLAIALFLLLPGGLAFALGFAAFSPNGGPNPLGAQAARPADVTNPTLQRALGSLEAVTRPDQVLDNPEALTPIKNALSDLVAGITSKKEEYASISNPDEALRLAKEMIANIDTIQGDPSGAEGREALSAYFKQKNALIKLWAPVASDIAQRIYEVANGHVDDKNSMFWEEPNVACASFVSTVLIEAGVMQKKDFCPAAFRLEEVLDERYSFDEIIPANTTITTAEVAKLARGDIIFYNANNPRNGSNIVHTGVAAGNGQLIDTSSRRYGYRVVKRTIGGWGSGSGTVDKIQVLRIKAKK